MDVLDKIREAKKNGSTSLYLNYYKLKKLPKEITQLTNLTALHLRLNELTELPEETMQLTNLTKLNLSFNQITKLSKEITQLRNLTELDLMSNQLTELPKEITQLTKLTKLKLGGNPLIKPPIEIATKGIKEIRNYFESIEEAETQKLYEAKLIIVGQGGVGKTCLTKKLIDNEYNINLNEVTTEGIAIENWTWKLFGNNSENEYKVNIWDFGGQEIYHSTHQFFLTKRSLYLFVWDARKEDDYSRFDYWLNVVSLLSGNSPVMVVLNKADERVKEIDQKSYKEKYDNIVGFHKVSCIRGDGIKELTGQVKTVIANLQHMGSDWPLSWADIRRELEGDKREYIDYTEYVEICKRHSLENEEKADYLSSYLHDLGVILHFQDDDILKNIVILKPEWGTNAVYKVLDTKSIQENKGKFLAKDLRQIWDKCTYPPQKHIELLQLMMKFELCFKLDDTEEYIVPELLPVEKPEYKWNSENNLRFEYHYEFMPSGIITRFIVRNHYLIEESFYWRNGAILNREKTRAVVASEPLKKKIIISIDGVNKRELLAIVRNEFEHIHETLNNPELKEMIPCVCSECKGGNSQNAEYYNLKDLERYVEKNKPTIECRKSLENVPLEKQCKIVMREFEESHAGDNIFISYSHKDSKWLEKFQIHLKPHVENCNIELWDDTKIKPGKLWFEEIQNALNSARVAILLVSPNFLASEFIGKNEFAPLLERAESKGVTIFWVAVSASGFEQTKLAKYQCANGPDEPLDGLSLAKQNVELVKICKKIKGALES